MKLFIDASRPTPLGFDFRAYSAQAAIYFIDNFDVTFISFGYDSVGHAIAHDVARHVEKIAAKGKRPPAYAVHSTGSVICGKCGDIVTTAMEGAHKAFKNYRLTNR